MNVCLTTFTVLEKEVGRRKTHQRLVRKNEKERNVSTEKESVSAYISV